MKKYVNTSGSLREDKMRDAPNLENSLASYSPIPDDAPVIQTV